MSKEQLLSKKSAAASIKQSARQTSLVGPTHLVRPALSLPYMNKQSLYPIDLLYLQRVQGNAFVQRMLNRQMAVQRNCPCEDDLQLVPANQLIQRNDDDQVTTADPNTPTTNGESESLGELFEWLKQLLQEVVRVLEQVGTMPEPLPREQPPANLDSGCRTFSSQADMDGRKAHWAGIIAAMPVPDVIQWIIGASNPPRAAATEAAQQKDCMLSAIRAAAAAPGSTIHLPGGNLTQSPHRTFTQQKNIWESKFNFEPSRRPFDRISDNARSICGSLLLASETRWDPGNPRHRVCWHVGPLPSTPAPAIPAGARALTDDERQQEILQASSAPGISRHHWGTDFDLFDPDMNPADWESGGPFADEYSWMMRNAATYGFIQSFTAFSTFMRMGYMEERWHWSYYPISQALLEFARAHQPDIERELLTRWGSTPQFTFIRRHWREFMFNVNERGLF